jgi:predicted ester cyclase
MTNAELVRAACQVVWTNGEVDRAGEFYAEDFHANYPMTDWGSGLAGVRQLATSVRVGFPDYRERIDELIDAGDNIIVRLTIKGTHTGPLPGLAATGKTVEFNDVTICRVENGKIVEQRGLTDYLSLYMQLGLVELPAAQAKSE